MEKYVENRSAKGKISKSGKRLDDLLLCWGDERGEIARYSAGKIRERFEEF
jgi:hypothetical protein